MDRVWVGADSLLEETGSDRGYLAHIKSKHSEAEMRPNNLTLKVELTRELRKVIIFPRVRPERRGEVGILALTEDPDISNPGSLVDAQVSCSILPPILRKP